MRHFDSAVARDALSRWEGDATDLAHIATSGNAVYRFRVAGADRILRLTDLAFRSSAHQAAEMAFLGHLQACGVRANAPVPSRSGRTLELFDECTACVLTWAPGIRVDPGTEHWTPAFLREWGATLGRIHAAAQSYSGPRRWPWFEEGLITGVGRLLPAKNHRARDEFERVRDHLHALPAPRETFGMTHADFAQQNFNFEPGVGITPFDFGNCCDHWFVSDIVISLSTFRRLPERARYRDDVLAGYREVRSLSGAEWAERHWFLRLRLLYVYLSRLEMFGTRPDEEQRATLERLEGLVTRRGGQREFDDVVGWL